MSEIERYRVDNRAFEIEPTRLKKDDTGSWCNWSDVKKLENKLKKAHEEIDRLNNEIEDMDRHR